VSGPSNGRATSSSFSRTADQRFTALGDLGRGGRWTAGIVSELSMVPFCYSPQSLLRGRLESERMLYKTRIRDPYVSPRPSRTVPSFLPISVSRRASRSEI